MANESKGTGSSSGFKRFFEQNKSMMVLLPLLVIMLIVVAIIYVPKLFNTSASNTNQTESTTAPTNAVEVLPQTERILEDASADNTTETSDDKVAKDPFMGPMSFNGVLLNNSGDNIAIITGNGVSYLVRMGDMIGDSLEVESITGEEVTLKENNDRTIVLKLEHKKSSQTANK